MEQVHSGIGELGQLQAFYSFISKLVTAYMNCKLTVA